MSFTLQRKPYFNWFDFLINLLKFQLQLPRASESAVGPGNRSLPPLQKCKTGKMPGCQQAKTVSQKENTLHTISPQEETIRSESGPQSVWHETGPPSLNSSAVKFDRVKAQAEENLPPPGLRILLARGHWGNC